VEDLSQDDKKVVQRFKDGAVDRFPQKEQAALWNRIEKSISPGKGRVLFFSFFSAAAGIILLLGVGYLWKNISASNNAATDWLVCSTGNEERIQVVLSDSSVVWVNAGSRLEYPARFAPDARNVKLDGEAYFDIRMEKNKPFTVLTNRIQVRVTGTAFTISDYADAGTTETVLVSGKVNVQVPNGDNYRNVKLLPDQQFILDNTNGHIRINDIEATKHAEWINGRLSFENATLGHIISRLERWYGVRFDCPDELQNSYQLTFTVRNESLPQIMQLVQNIAPVRFEQTGTKINIRYK
jgi:ferric-dicitrate binding protein FerR (iron transport regulator)